jgi:Polyketide cyclase / dehydrase and lipid transport
VWETTVRVGVSSVVDAPPERAWSLLSSPAAWSARRVSCLMFDIPVADAGTDVAAGAGADARLRFYLGAAGGRAAARVYLVADEVPGRTICLRTPDGRATWQLSAEPARRGTKLRIAGTFVVPRASKLDVVSDQRRELKPWLKNLSASAEGRAPWPGDGAADRVREACAAGVPSRDAVECSASVHIDVPTAGVSRALLGPPELLQVVNSQVAFSGYVPGTPAGQVGGLRYYVHRRSHGSLLASCALVAAASPSGVIVRYVTPPFPQLTYTCEPADAGTSLELTFRCPGRSAKGQDTHRDLHAEATAALVARWKAAIEGLAGL